MHIVLLFCFYNFVLSPRNTNMNGQVVLKPSRHWPNSEQSLHLSPACVIISTPALSKTASFRMADSEFDVPRWGRDAGWGRRYRQRRYVALIALCLPACGTDGPWQLAFSHTTAWKMDRFSDLIIHDGFSPSLCFKTPSSQKTHFIVKQDKTNDRSMLDLGTVYAIMFILIRWQ